MLENFRTYKIAVDFYRNCQAIKLPRHLKDQLDRASSSIALNLAEGRGKPTTKDQRRFFYIALGSVRECQAILDIGGLKDSIQWNMVDHLAASLYQLIKRAN